MNKKNIKIARLSTVTFFLDHQLRHQIKDHIKEGMEVTAIASSCGNWEGLESVENLKCIKLDIARAPAPIKDLISTYNLYCLFREEKYDIVHSTTPKAGLLCAIAGYLAGTPIRIHTFTGQTWATKTGFSRWLLRLMDKLIVLLDTQCYADSPSQRTCLIQEKVGSENSIQTLGYGSLAGVDLSRFNAEAWKDQKASILKELGIEPDDFVMLFVGRLSKEKGIYELISAFFKLQNDSNKIRLVLLGPCEEKAVEEKLKDWTLSSKIDYLGPTETPEKYLSIADLLCLPSYREGFGTVVIEAAAMQVPTLGTDINGLKDAVEDGVTGMLVPTEDSDALYETMKLFIHDPKLAQQMGIAAYRRCKKVFDSTVLSRLVSEQYQYLLSKKNLDS